MKLGSPASALLITRNANENRGDAEYAEDTQRVVSPYNGENLFNQPQPELARTVLVERSCRSWTAGLTQQESKRFLRWPNAFELNGCVWVEVADHNAKNLSRSILVILRYRFELDAEETRISARFRPAHVVTT